MIYRWIKGQKDGLSAEGLKPMARTAVAYGLRHRHLCRIRLEQHVDEETTASLKEEE